MKGDKTSELLETMFQFFRQMKKEMSYTDEMSHLSVLQIQTLIFLKYNENVPTSDIADYFRIELPSATSLLNKLCDQKLVERRADKEDRRLVRVALTEKGETLARQAHHDRKKKIEKLLSYLNDREKEQLLVIFKTLNERLHSK